MLVCNNLSRSCKKKVADKLEVTAERVVAEYAKLAYANVADTMKKGMTFEDIIKLDKNVSAAIESVTVVQTETKTGKSTSVKLKMHSKTAALDALGRHTGIFEKDNAQKVELFKAFLGVDMDKV